MLDFKEKKVMEQISLVRILFKIWQVNSELLKHLQINCEVP